DGGLTPARCDGVFVAARLEDHGVGDNEKLPERRDPERRPQPELAHAERSVGPRLDSQFDRPDCSRARLSFFRRALSEHAARDARTLDEHLVDTREVHLAFDGDLNLRSPLDRDRGAWVIIWLRVWGDPCAAEPAAPDT